MTGRAARTVAPLQLGVAAAGSPDLPGLARTSRAIAEGLCAIIAEAGGAVSVSIGDVRMPTLRDWKASLDTQVAIARFSDPAIKGGFVMAMPRRLVAALVDLSYGGCGSPAGAVPGGGVAEQRLFERLATAAGAAVARAWAPIEKLSPALAQATFDTDALAFGKLSDAVVIQPFALTGPQGGDDAIEIAYPLAALRGIAALQHATDGVPEAVDPVWRARLSDAVMQSRLPVRTVLARPTVSLNRLVALAPGDFIALTLPARVPLTVAGRLLAHGTIGEANGRAAIKIDKLEQGATFDD